MLPLDIQEFGEHEDAHHMTSEEEKDYYSGVGKLVIFIIQNTKDNFEFDVLESSGCARWLCEGLGADYALTEEWFGSLAWYKEGTTCAIEDISVNYIRGDGWATDDDEEWDYGARHKTAKPLALLLYKIEIIAWRRKCDFLRLAKKALNILLRNT